MPEADTTTLRTPDEARSRRVREFFRDAPVRESWPWRHWNAHPTVARAIARRVSGAPDRTLLDILPEVLAGLGLAVPAARAASLGCGRGRLDRALYRHGVVDALTGFDLSPESIAAARHFAAAAGIAAFDYRTADLDTIELEPGAYDLIVVEMALHHVAELERLADRIAAALVPGGLLLFDEYVGPTRFRWTERQIDVVNGLLALLPPELRLTPDGIVKPPIRHEPPEFFERNDPSEAIRSGEVVAALETRFEIRWCRRYGGTILHPLLHDIALNFRVGEPLCETLLAAAIAIEDAMIAAGDLASDFAVMVAAPR